MWTKWTVEIRFRQPAPHLMMIPNFIWRFPKSWGYLQIIQVPCLRIETYGDDSKSPVETPASPTFGWTLGASTCPVTVPSPLGCSHRNSAGAGGGLSSFRRRIFAYDAEGRASRIDMGAWGDQKVIHGTWGYISWEYSTACSIIGNTCMIHMYNMSIIYIHVNIWHVSKTNI